MNQWAKLLKLYKKIIFKFQMQENSYFFHFQRISKGKEKCIYDPTFLNKHIVEWNS